MALYKYVKKEHLDAFFTKGSVKIGSLYEYRKVEHYGTVIGDDAEGYYHTELSQNGTYEVDLAESSPEADFFRQHLLRPDQQHLKTKIIMEDGAKIISRTNSPDLYIYCVTSEFNRQVMKDFGCDSCIEIRRPELFFRALSKQIRHKADFEIVTGITYGDKNTHYKTPHEVHPALKKGDNYAYQKEVRAIWTPKKEIKQPLFVDVPKAIRACSVFPV
ncbi:hypothetical protein [Vibrio parahaemolyticus]|uniref:hypothetical protein n=1 Tax=Vibrio parahaemolyticus TaxID=670 RepID=UPI002285CE0D|nr:hypothetical protein [Vibrio parahaemolyticus]